jgi:NADPH:quinone reductase-like Zn-dependent oxidoreductase
LVMTRCSFARHGPSIERRADLAVHPAARRDVRNENNKDLEVIAELIEAEKLRPAIDRTCLLANLPDAMRDLEAGRVRGKIVVAISK